jgi:hypothetical protein
MRMVRNLLWSLLAVAAFALPVQAQNGLQRFERDLKPQLEFSQLTYASASPLGDNGFVLNDVTAVVPPVPGTTDKPSTVKVQKVTVEAFDFAHLPPPKSAKSGTGKSKGKNASDDDAPRFVKAKFEGVTGDDDINTVLKRYGIPTTPVDVVFDYALDADKKVLSLNKIELSLRGLGRLELNVILDGISEKTGDIAGAQDDGRLRTATLTIDDKGLLAQLLPAMAKESGGTAEMWIGMAQSPIQGFAATQGPETVKQLDAVVSFLADWKQPKGPIKITLTPPKTVGVDDLDKVFQPNGLTDVLGLVVLYEGTRPGAAGGGLAAPAPRAQRAPQTATRDPSAADDTKTKRLTGKDAWDTVVGNTLTGKQGGKTYHDYYRKDGTVIALEDGEIETGKWTLEGDKICTKFPDEDKNCFSIVASGRTVTLTDAKGKGLRATLLRGNPKDL